MKFKTSAIMAMFALVATLSAPQKARADALCGTGYIRRLSLKAGWGADADVTAMSVYLGNETNAVLYVKYDPSKGQREERFVSLRNMLQAAMLSRSPVRIDVNPSVTCNIATPAAIDLKVCTTEQGCGLGD